MEEKKKGASFMGGDFLKNIMEFQNNLLRFWEAVFGVHVPPAAKGVNVEDYLKGEHFKNFFSMLEKTQEAFKKIYKMWLPLGKKMYSVKDLREIPELYNQILETSLSAYREVLDNVFGPLMPGYFKEYLSKIYEISFLTPANISSLSAPWFQAMITTMELLPDVVKGEGDAVEKANEAWWNAYSNTFGKLMRGTLLGMFRERMERVLRVFDGFLRYSLSYADFSAELYRAGVTSVERFSSRLVELEDPDFYTFYKTWMETSEETFIELFRSDKFGRLLGALNTYSMKFKMALDNFLEDIIKQFPIPVRTEMDRLYKTVYDMRLDIKRLNKALKALEAKVSKTKKEGGE